MRKRTLFALAIAATVVVAACSSGASLTGKTWQLTAMTKNVAEGLPALPVAQQANYTITFNTDLSLNIKADCNTVGGTYVTTSSGGLTITLGASTKVACPEGSLADQYLAGLSSASSYTIVSNELTIVIPDGWSLIFK